MTYDYVLADDLSGALEAGAAFRARGRRVILQLDDRAPWMPETGTLQLLSSETRNASGAAAAARVRQLLARQQAAGARLRFKKIDSTLRGPVGEEIKALIEELAPPLVVVCPANPAVGRTVRDGRLLVRGMPVADTEFRHDPGWPVTESRIVATLAEGGIENIASLPLARLRSEPVLPPADCRGVLVSDAVTEGDLARLVSLVCSQQPDAVFIGAGGLARALAVRHAVREDSEPPGRVAFTSVLVVSGSRHERSRRQLEVLRDQHGFPLHELGFDFGAEAAAAEHVARSLADSGRAALTLAPDTPSNDHIGPVRKLATVIKLLSAAGAIPEMLAVTGGETARALCDALLIAQLNLVGEGERGVVIVTIVGFEPVAPRYLAIKPGGFGLAEVWDGLILGFDGQKMK